MKYVECNLTLLNALAILSSALVAAVNLTSCTKSVKVKAEWDASINEYTQEVKNAYSINEKIIIEEEGYLEQIDVLKQELSKIRRNTNSKLYTDQIKYLKDSLDDFISNAIIFEN